MNAVSVTGAELRCQEVEVTRPRRNDGVGKLPAERMCAVVAHSGQTYRDDGYAHQPRKCQYFDGDVHHHRPWPARHDPLRDAGHALLQPIVMSRSPMKQSACLRINSHVRYVI